MAGYESPVQRLNGDSEQGHYMAIHSCEHKALGGAQRSLET